MCAPRPLASFRVLSSLMILSALSPSGCDSSAEQDHVIAMAREHAGDRPVASAAASAAIALPRGTVAAVTEEEVTYATVAGRPVHGFLARPQFEEGSVGDPGASRAPGILVIHEWWGLNDNIRAMARQLAASGYTALAVDLYAGEVAENPTRARELMQASTDRPDALRENLRQAHRFLEREQHAPRTAAIGWCFGGGWSLQAALLLPGQLDAAVIYYGRPVTEPSALERLDTPLLGHFGSEDRGIPVERVREFRDALDTLGKDARIHIYQGADHAFANPSGTRYDPAAAEEAWARTLAFLERTLAR